MDNQNKKYDPVKIPDQQNFQSSKDDKKEKNKEPGPIPDGLFYEIEYDSSPIKGVGKFVLKPQPIAPREKDKIREIFYAMRDISRNLSSPFISYSSYYDKRVQQNNAKIFYKQAIFMKDFEDDFAHQTSFESYFPNYQLMNYKQLRTYFTWRTQIRKGNITSTSLSYAFVYIYELINNIGVDNPQDGLEKLMTFWKTFSQLDQSINKYVYNWLKDYHIYYNLPQSFHDFVKENGFTDKYPKILESINSFDLFCDISKYDIRKSKFYSDKTYKLIEDCFYFVLETVREKFKESGMNFDDAIFRPRKNVATWVPFKDAVFYPCANQKNRKILISKDEIYVYRNKKWTFSTIITTEKGKSFIGYVMKHMECILRKLTHFKYKISANINMINPETLKILIKSNIYIDKIVETAVLSFYREATKTVVKVDSSLLSRIRQESIATQEALIVDETVEIYNTNIATIENQNTLENSFADSLEVESNVISDIWLNLKSNLSNTELQTLSLILQGENIKQFADTQNIMLEVLVESINDKAMDFIGDNILDDEFLIYSDYENQVKEMIGL